MTASKSSEALTLVIGGNGKTGSRVARRLEAKGVPVRIGSRSGEPPFDWHDATTWPGALSGVQRVYISYAPDVAMPGAAQQIADLASLAAANDVQRIVMLSGRNEEEAFVAERGVRRSGVDFTIVRSSWFAQNFSEGALLGPVLSGTVALPAADVPEPFVDIDDIAEVATAALTEDGHAGRTYEITGARLWTFSAATHAIAEASGRPVRFQPVSPEQYEGALREHVPPAIAALLSSLFARILDGRNSHLTDGVQQALGRPARDFGDFVRRAAASGAWSS